MKKIFTLLFALMAVVAANAAKEISLTGFSAWGSGITYDEATKTFTGTSNWPGGQFTVDEDASSYKYVVAKFTGSHASCNINYNGWWGEKLAVTASVAADQEYSFTEITEEGWKPGQYHIQQVQFQFTCDGSSTPVTATIESIQLISQAEYDAIISGSGIDPTAIWTGSNDFGSTWEWGKSLGFNGAAFNDVKSGESLVFEFTASGTDNQLNIELGQYGGSTTLSYFKSQANSYNCVAVSGVTSYEVPLTDDDITSLKSEGLRVKGKEITLSKIKHMTSTFTPTAIKSVSTTAANGVAYNLAGQHVNKNAKGLVIINGKKIMN